MLVAPYQDGTSLQFRVVNRRRNDLMELEARVMLMTVDSSRGRSMRQYKLLKLEREKVLFLPLTWTVVHPIDEESPLRGATPEDLASQQAEIMILIKAYDDTFSQTVLSRYSYRHDEILWHKRFSPAFDVDPEGDLVLDVERVGEFNEAP
jgi:inward rectifier potassium channel